MCNVVCCGLLVEGFDESLLRALLLQGSDVELWCDSGRLLFGNVDIEVDSDNEVMGAECCIAMAAHIDDVVLPRLAD